MHLKSGIVVLAFCLAQAGGVYAQEANVPEKGDLNTMPKWSEFPVIPDDVPTAADIKKRVESLKTVQRSLNAEVDAMVWDPQEPEKIAAEGRQEIASTLPPPVDEVMTPEQLEAFAAGLRAKAAPPPLVPF